MQGNIEEEIGGFSRAFAGNAFGVAGGRDPSRMGPRRAPPGWFLDDQAPKRRAVPAAPGDGTENQKALAAIVIVWLNVGTGP